MSGLAEVNFKDGKREIPSCDYEFAKRYPDSSVSYTKVLLLNLQIKIFESTNTK